MKKIIQILTLATAAYSLNAFAGKILYISDSHSTAPYAPFGSRMNTLLRTLPDAEVSFHSRCGSTVNWWYNKTADRCGYFDQEPHSEAVAGFKMPAPSVVEMLDSFKPTLMIAQLGANYMAGNDWGSYAKPEVQKLVNDLRLRSIPCLWVGQPDYRLPADANEAALSLKRRNALIQTIRETVEPVCIYVDSTTMTRYPATGGDGHHYSMKEGLETGFAWADTVFNQYVTALYRK